MIPVVNVHWGFGQQVGGSELDCQDVWACSCGVIMISSLSAHAPVACSSDLHCASHHVASHPPSLARTPQPMLSVLASPDGSTVVAGGKKGHAHMWRLEAPAMVVKESYRLPQVGEMRAVWAPLS